MLRHVWIARHHILHKSGYEERCIWGVFPDWILQTLDNQVKRQRRAA